MRAALELHKEVIQGLQTVDAFSQDLFLPEEIDFHLNKQQDSFISELLDEGFADRQLRLDYTQDLIVKNKKLDVFLSPTAFYYESGAVCSFFPGDYKYLLDVRTSIIEAENCAEIKEEVKPKKYYFYTLELKTTRTEPPYYEKVQIVNDVGPTFNEEIIMSSVEAPAQDADDTYLVVRNMLNQFNKKYNDFELYWEKYTDGERQGNVVKNTFIIRSETPNLNFILRTVRGITKEESFSEVVTSEVESYEETFLKKLKRVGYTSTAILDNKDVYSRQQNSFFLPKKVEPHTVLSDGLIFNYYSPNFIIDSVLIDYIREPQPISIINDQGCELSISASHIIANRTIEYLKLAIENPTYREVLQHNTIRDQK